MLFSSHQLDLVEDLSEDVVIVDHGRVVLAGELEELRAAVPQRFVDIRFTGTAPDWSTLASVAVVDASDDHVRRVSGAMSMWRRSCMSHESTLRSSRSRTSRRHCRSCSDDR